jgi:ribonuclease HII
MRGERQVKVIVGVDEAGRGSLAGPVVVSAVAFVLHTRIDGVNDSKKLSESTRDSLRPQIISACEHRTVVIPEDQIESLNILGASMRGMYLAVRPWLHNERALILVDGNVLIPDIPASQQVTVVKGDSKSACIASASILAKTARDDIMDWESSRYPVYAFSRNKGYGSPEHLESLREYGMCSIHRPSFCIKFLSQTESLF